MKSLHAISRPFTKSTSPPPPRETLTPPRVREPSYTPSPPGPPRLDLQLGEPSDFSLGTLDISFNELRTPNSTGPTASLPEPPGSPPLPDPSAAPATLPTPPPTLESVLPELGLSRPGLQTEPSEAALHLPALTPSVARQESESRPINPNGPNLSSTPSNSVNSPNAHPTVPPSSFTQQPALQHSLSITSSPPDYYTLSPTGEAPFASYHRPASDSSPALNPRAVSLRNKEKQALRDTWAKQDAERQAYGDFYLFPVPHTAHASPPLAQSGAVQGFEPRDGSGSSGSAGTQGRRQSSSVGGAVESLNVLPAGMDIRDALAKCEDPGLGWSLQFWVTIADPQTHNVFFACPASGQCSWDAPVGAMIVPRMPEGEWWELADASRGNRCYYYNTMTGKTQWTRPQGNAFVIPLGLIQRNALPKTQPTNGTAAQSPDYLSPNRIPTSPPVTPNRQPAIPPRTSSSPPKASPNTRSTSPPKQSGRSSSHSPDFTSIDTTTNPPSGSGDRGFPSEPSQSTVASNTVLRTPLSVVDEGSGNETDVSESGSPGWWGKRKSKGPRINGFKGKGRDIGDLAEMERTASGQDVALEREEFATTLGNDSAGPSAPEPIPVFRVRTKRMSTGLHPLLPTSISDEIQAFRTEDFAAKYFATKRTGMLRARVPFDEIMQWQKQPITSPLLVISRSLTKDAITTFKVIQHVMGERDKPVDQAKPSSSTATALNTAARSKMKRDGVYLLKLPNRSAAKVNGSRANISQLDGSIGMGLGQADGVDDKMVVLEEIRWMLQLAVVAVEMRDEVYSQLTKQLTRNPAHNAMVMGFQLFCILVNSFGPSKNFEAFVRRFLENDRRGTDGISRMAQYCLGRLDHMSRRRGRGRSLTIGEIEHAADAAFYPSVYGESLDQIMSLQAPTYPDLKVPVILLFLADGILALGGLRAEGIFRVPGDGDSVSELRSRIDRGHYVLTGIGDPHVGASLFKLWLRDLREPVIPEDLYNDALVASKSAESCLAFVDRLPVLNRRVLLFVISFFQLFLKEEVVEVTKMTRNNLSLVLAPNILRTTSDHLVTVFTNSSFESKFTLQLLEQLDPRSVDPDYKPVHGK